MNHCQKCHSPLKPGQSFCQQCGTRCDQVLPASAPAGASPSNTNQCPNCKALLKPGQSFCQQCGTRCDQVLPASAPAGASPANANQCPNCKALLKPGQSFCQQCGTNLDNSAPTGQANVTPSPAEPLPDAGEVAVAEPERPATSPLADKPLPVSGEVAAAEPDSPVASPLADKPLPDAGKVAAAVPENPAASPVADEPLPVSGQKEENPPPESQEKTNTAPAKSKSTSRTGLILAIVVIAILFIAGGSYFLFKNKKEDERITQAQTASSESFETEVEGVYEIKGKWGFINEVSPESGDLIQHYFRTNSSVGKQVAQVCRPSEDCKIIAEVILKSMDDLPAGLKADGSAIYEVARIKSVEPVSAPESTPTPAGKIRTGALAINNHDTEKKSLLLDNKVIYSDMDAYLLSVEKIFALHDKDIILLGINSGGTACPLTYTFITVLPDGRVVHSKKFGTCSDQATAVQTDNGIQVTMPGYGDGADKPGVYRYVDGNVVEEKEPVKQHQAPPEPEAQKVPAVPAPVVNKEKPRSVPSDSNRKKPVANAGAATRSEKTAETEKSPKTEKSGLSKLWKSVKEAAKKGKIEQQKDDAWRN